MSKKHIIIGIVCLLTPAILATPIEATTIQTELCGSTERPLLSFSAPLSDSVVTASTIRLQGTAIRTTQIDIAVNGIYSSSLAVGSSEQVDTAVALFTGTNTIDIRAYYSCNQTTSTHTIILTYEPSTTPSAGPTTDTTLPPQTTGAPSPSTFTPTTPGTSPQPADTPAPDVTTPTPPKTPSYFMPDENFDWIPAALIGAALVTPSLLLFMLERLGNTIGTASRKLSTRQQWMVRASGLILAGLLAVLLYGVAGRA